MISFMLAWIILSVVFTGVWVGSYLNRPLCTVASVRALKNGERRS